MTINITRYYTTLENRGSVLKPQLSDQMRPAYVAGDCNRVLKDAIVVVEPSTAGEQYRLAWLRNPQTTQETQTLLKEYAEIKVAVNETQGKTELCFTAQELYPFASEDPDWYYSAPVLKHQHIQASNTGLATAESHGVETADQWSYIQSQHATSPDVVRLLQRIIKRQKVFIVPEADGLRARLGWRFDSYTTQLLRTLPHAVQHLTFKIQHQGQWYLGRFHSLAYGTENTWHRGVAYRFSIPVKLIRLNLESKMTKTPNTSFMKDLECFSEPT